MICYSSFQSDNDIKEIYYVKIVELELVRNLVIQYKGFFVLPWVWCGHRRGLLSNMPETKVFKKAGNTLRCRICILHKSWLQYH